MILLRRIWRGSLGGLDLLRGYIKLFGEVRRAAWLTFQTQIRIVADNSEAQENGIKPKKKKKSHRGYAFVVYEREKDMKGTASNPRPHDGQVKFSFCDLDLCISRFVYLTDTGAVPCN